VRELRAERVLGNHEEKHIRFRIRELEVRAGRRPNNLMEFKPEQRELNAKLTKEDWDYVKGSPVWLDLGDGVTVVHAGFEPGVPMEEQSPDRVVRLVYVDKTGMMAKHEEDFRKKPKDSERWAKSFDRFNVVYGHAVFSLRDPQIDDVGGVTHYGIDTGCYAGGYLSAWVREPGAAPMIVQVQAKRCYLPREVSET
jgi:hypothetical protein